MWLDRLIADVVDHVCQACDGLILAFFHAIKDKDKEGDNDPKLRHQEWSNYCGTPGFTDEVSKSITVRSYGGLSVDMLDYQDLEYMWDDVSKALPVKPIKTPAPPPERVFLIHATEESNVRPDTVIFAWPPPRIRKKFEVEMDDKVIKVLGGQAWSGQSEDDDVDEDELDMFGRRRSELVPRMDGKYWAQDYAELMKHVELENKTGRPDAWGTFGKTSCTQRFQGGHLLTNEGVWRKIESVFIPYGKITFACFQTVQIMPISEAPTGTTPQVVMPGGQPQSQIPWIPNVWPPNGSAIQPVQGAPQLATFASGPSPMPSHLLPVDPLERMSTTKSMLGSNDKLGFPLYSPSTTQTVKPPSSRSPPPPAVLPSQPFTLDQVQSHGLSGYEYPQQNVYPPQPYGAPSANQSRYQDVSQPTDPTGSASQPLLYPSVLSDWAPQPDPLTQPQMQNGYYADSRGVKRKPYDMGESLMLDNGGFEGQYMSDYQPALDPTLDSRILSHTAEQIAAPSDLAQPVLTRGSAALSEQQENDQKKKAAIALEKEPLRPAVPPPDGIECCTQCGTKER